MACYNQNKIFTFKIFTIMLIVETFVFNIIETNGLPLEEYSISMTWNKMLQNGSLATNMIYVLLSFKMKLNFQYQVRSFIF